MDVRVYLWMHTPPNGLMGVNFWLNFLLQIRTPPFLEESYTFIKAKGKLWSRAKKETELKCPTSIYYIYLFKLILDEYHRYYFN